MKKRPLRLEDFEELSEQHYRIRSEWTREAYIAFRLNYNVMSIFGFDTSDFDRFIPIYDEVFNVRDGVHNLDEK